MATTTLSATTSNAVAMTPVTMAIATTVSTGVSMALAVSKKWK